MSSSLAVCLLLGSTCLVTCAGKAPCTSQDARTCTLLADCGRPPAQLCLQTLGRQPCGLLSLSCYWIGQDVLLRRSGHWFACSGRSRVSRWQPLQWNAKQPPERHSQLCLCVHTAILLCVCQQIWAGTLRNYR